VKCEVVAVGTELLLGQIVDSNSSWIGEQLALAGIDSFFQTKVGDNLERMVEALETALHRSDAVIVTGGLGPTHDDITRDAIAKVMGVELVRDDELAGRIRAMFEVVGREMPDNNLRQADLPEGATPNPIQPGTAPGLICEVDRGGAAPKMIYAVPGVPWEMKKQITGGVIPDLQERAGVKAVIRNRTIRTWGRSESGLAEILDEEITRLDHTGAATIAFLASGWNGLLVRVTAKAASGAEVDEILDTEQARIMELIGDVVFGFDEDTMESVVLQDLRDRGLTLGLAESLTGGLIASRITAIPGCSDVFRGGVIPYNRELKVSVLGTSDIPAVSEQMAIEMAEGVCSALDTDVGLAVTGVAGPSPHEGHDPGTVWIGLCINGRTDSAHLSFRYDRERIRQFTCISALAFLRNRLLSGDREI